MLAPLTLSLSPPPSGSGGIYPAERTRLRYFAAAVLENVPSYLLKCLSVADKGVEVASARSCGADTRHFIASVADHDNDIFAAYGGGLVAQYAYGQASPDPGACDCRSSRAEDRPSEASHHHASLLGRDGRVRTVSSPNIAMTPSRQPLRPLSAPLWPTCGTGNLFGSHGLLGCEADAQFSRGAVLTSCRSRRRRPGCAELPRDRPSRR